MKLLVYVVWLLIALPLHAQKDSSVSLNSLQLVVGVQQIKEENLHPKIHTGVVYGLEYAHNSTKKNSSNFSFLFKYSTPKTKFEDAAYSTHIQLNANYNYSFKLIKKKTYSLYLGPSASSHYRLSYYPYWDDSHLYWADDFSLGVAHLFSYNIHPNTALVARLNVSLLSLFSRPILHRAYKIDDVSLGGIISSMNSNFELGTIDRAFDLSLQTEYHIRISKKVIQAIVYHFEYSHFQASTGRSFSNLQHHLGFKLYFE